MPVLFSGTKQKDNYNRPLYGFQGKYTLSPSLYLPYFITAMPVERVIDELKIAEQISPSLDNRWSLNELFQREVDRDRVDRELVRGYLADPHKIKFFNALTIVLIPNIAEPSISDVPQVAPAEPEIPWDGKDEEDRAWGTHLEAKRAAFSGVQYVEIGDQARLRWDLDRMNAVAVDGQHRLVALQDYKEKYKHKVLSTEELKTSVPIIFLLLAPQVGFRSDKSAANQNIRTIARELFTDLNKNAKKVDSARQLVLDDWDLVARCVRTLVTDEATKDSSEVLPLTLVRWQDAINRFDEGYYLNSLVHLQMLVDDVLDLPAVKPMDGQSAHNYIKRVGAVLGEGGEIKDPVTHRTLLDVYEKDYCDTDGVPQTPFVRLPAAYLEIAVQGFVKHHRPWMIRLLTEFAPYKKLLTYARNHNLIEGEFGKWHAQTKAHREQLKSDFIARDQNWFKRTIENHTNTIAAIKGNKNDSDWSFKAIFQKALVQLTSSIAFEGGYDTHRMGNMDTFLGVFNTLHERGVLMVRCQLKDHPFGLWAFIGTNPGSQKIKVTSKVEQNILALLRLWYYSSRKVFLDRHEDANVAASAAALEGSLTTAEPQNVDGRKLLSFFEAKKNTPLWPEADEAVRILRDVLSSTILYKANGIPDIAETDDQKKKIDDDRAKAVSKRLIAIIEAGLVIDGGAPA